VLFVSVWTIPKIAFVVNKLCKYMSNPGDKHVAALKRLLRYLAGIKDHGLVYTGSADPCGLVGFSDSSHMDCPDTSRSTVAFVFFFNNCVVSWFSKLHGFVTTCTNHSEYAALFMASKEAFHLIAWLRPLEEFLKLRLEPTPIYLDNDGAKALSKDPVGRNKNKHVRMSHHYTQELVAEGVIVTLEVDTSENCADVLTKALGPNVFQVHADKLASDTTKAIPAPTGARVMMIRGVERSAPSAPQHWRRPQRTVGARLVASVGVQTDDLPSVASVGAQCSSSGDTAHNAYFRQATAALYAALEYQEEILETVVIVQAQSQRARDVSRTLHARLQGILEEVAERRADEEFKDYQYPEPSEVDSPESPELEDSPYSPVANPEYNERPLGLQALPRLVDVPPGVHDEFLLDNAPPDPEPAVVGSHPEPAQEELTEIHCVCNNEPAISGGMPIPYPHPPSPTAPLRFSPPSCGPDAGLLDEKDQSHASQGSGDYIPGEFSDHFRVYDFGHNFAFCAQCFTASERYGGCSFSNWDAFRVWPDTLCFSANVAFDGSTLSGFLPSVNSIVTGYLGKFCVATYRACVNVPPRESFCNHCRRWGHSFSLDSCTVRGYGASAALQVPVPWCAYCQKAGHVVESCRRRIGDRGYLQVRSPEHKRKRR
jgi:hypothetical protein